MPRFAPEADVGAFAAIGFVRGDAIIRTFEWRDDGGPMDLTGVRIEFRIATNPVTVLTTDAAGGIVLEDQTAPDTRGMFTVTFSQAVVAAIPDEPATPYGIRGEIDGAAQTFGRGEINIFRGGA